MLQEQVSEYLGVTSFKRKYPGKTEVKNLQQYSNLKCSDIQNNHSTTRYYWFQIHCSLYCEDFYSNPVILLTIKKYFCNNTNVVCCNVLTR